MDRCVTNARKRMKDTKRYHNKSYKFESKRSSALKKDLLRTMMNKLRHIRKGVEGYQPL